MYTVKKVARNIGALTIGRVFTASAAFLMNMMLARYLSIEDFGVLNFAMSYAALFLLFTNLGVSQIVTRKISRGDADAQSLLGNSFTLISVLSIFVTIIAIVSVNLVGYSELTALAASIYALSILFMALQGIFSISLTVHLEMMYSSISTIIQKFGALGLVALMIFLNYDVITLVTANLVAVAVGTVFMFFFSMKYIRFSPKVDFGVWKSLLIESWPFALMGLFMVIHFRIDLLMISLLSTELNVGYYSAVYKLAETPLILISATTVSIFPILSKFFADKIRIQKILRICINVSMTLAIPMATGATLLSKGIIDIVYGAKYLPIADSFSVTVWSVVMIFMIMLFATSLNATNKEKNVIKITLVGLIANVILNIFCIPQFGYLGSSMATALVLMYMLVMFYGEVKKDVGFRIGKIKMLKIVFSSAVMALFIWFAPSMHVLIMIPLAMIVYFVSLFLIGGIESEEISLGRSILKPKDVSQGSQDLSGVA